MRPSMARLRRGLRDLAGAIYQERAPLEDLRILPLGAGIAPQELPIPSANTSGWRVIQPGDRWGGIDQNAWFHGDVAVPVGWLDQMRREPGKMVVLRMLLGANVESGFGWPEGLLYVNRRLQQGINRHHIDVLLPTNAVTASGRLTIDIRAWSGLYHTDHRLEYAEIALLDRDLEALYYLLKCGADLVDALPEQEPLLPLLAEVLGTAYNHLNMTVLPLPPVAGTLAWLREQLAQLRREYTPAHRPRVTAVGHGHLDVAWLWQTHHTREKAARTFGVAMSLLDLYPSYVYLHTTPQVYTWLKQDYPELYQRVREHVAQGRFEAAGSMWVESDCNLVSGESLVRQILYGERFLQEEFERSYDVLWLPDTFGYSAALPQILLRAGITSFMTTKLSWNDTNRLPADTFRWRGIDGSEILAYFITTPTAGSPPPPMDAADTYNGTMDVFAVGGAWNRYRQKALNDEVLLAFGHGDGGAGPTRQHLEAAQALRELPGLPELHLGRADEFFLRLRQRVWQDPSLPVWDGELYFEYHRGTYTSQAWLKRLHRRCEQRLLLVETLDAWQMLMSYGGDASGGPDNRPETLDEAWRTLLLHEFHDILPGSSIAPVYADARESLTRLLQTLDTQIEDLVTAIAVTTNPASTAVVFNPSPWQRSALIEVAAQKEKGRQPRRGASGVPTHGWEDLSHPGRKLRIQPAEQDGREIELVEVPSVPGLGFVSLARRPGGDSLPFYQDEILEPARGESGRSPVLENAYFSLRFNQSGEITSCVDKRVPGGRELLPKGAVANQFQAFDDRPRNFDAWDIDSTFEEKRYPLDDAGAGSNIQLVESGPLRATLQVRRSLLASSIVQHISLYRSEPRIDFVTRIQWSDHHVLLKVAFPLDLRVRQATYEIQYGVVERPTHRNTSWDQARFETSAHRFIDLSEWAYGVSLLNDGCYGGDIRDGIVRLTLLRSPTEPDPEADQGEHMITYSLYPHLGDWRSGGTVAAAYRLNRPVVVQDRRAAPEPSGSSVPADDLSGAAAGGSGALFWSTQENVVIEAVKRQMQGDGYVVRVYECYGSRCSAHISCSLPLFAGVVECDLLERPLTREVSPAFEQWWASPVASHDTPVWDGTGWSFELRPFEIRTFLLRRNA
jgi:alpha-mannosidase